MATVTVPSSGALPRRRIDKWGLAFQAGLIFCIVACFAFLFVLIADVFSDGVGVFTDRGTDFLTSNLSTRPAEAGVWQAIKGSLLLAGFVVVIAFPLGVATAVYLEEYRARQPIHSLRRVEHPQPRRRSIGRVRTARLGGVRRAARNRHGVRRRAHRRSHLARRRPDAFDPRAADRDHHLGRGDPRGPRLVAGRRLRPRRRTLRRRPPARAPERSARNPHGHRALIVSRSARRHH